MARDDQFYWDGLSDGRLMVRVCDACERAAFPPMPGCPHCGHESGRVVQSAGGGSLYSWTQCHVAFAPELAHEVPYVVGLIDLPEQARIVARIEGVPASQLYAGLELVAKFDRVDADGQPSLTFMPADARAAR